MVPLILSAALLAQTPTPVLSSNSADVTEKLALLLRTVLLRKLPSPLYEKSSNWGHKNASFSRIKWRGQGLDVHPEVVRTEKEDGEWHKLRVTAQNAEQNLQLTLSNVQHPSADTTAFDILIGLPVRAEFERQIWKEGVRLYSGSARARARVWLALHCEMTSKVDTAKFFPELVFRLRVVKAEVAYDQFVMEHIAGFGGDAAGLVGDVIRKVIHQWKPSIERDLLEKADRAIIKAGDTKEIRLGFEGLKRKK